MKLQDSAVTSSIRLCVVPLLCILLRFKHCELMCSSLFILKRNNISKITNYSNAKITLSKCLYQEGRSSPVPNFDLADDKYEFRLFGGVEIMDALLLEDDGRSRVRARLWGVLGLLASSLIQS